MGIFAQDKTPDELEEEAYRTKTQINLEEQRALLREVKHRYGRDWKRHLPNIKSGMDWSALKFKL